LREDPNNAELMGLIACALHDDGHHQHARGWAERALSIDPHLPWVHQVRTRSILDGAGQPREALTSAWTASQLDPHGAGPLYDLCRSYVAVGDLPAATWAAEQICRVDPTSPLGPTAKAVVEIGRVRTLRFRNVVLAVIVVLLTRGVALAVWALWWLVLRARRIGHLRRADAHLKDALRLNPGFAGVHRLAAEVAKMRLRFADSIDRDLAAAALDSGLVSADELVNGISQRTVVLGCVLSVLWALGALVAQLLVPTVITVLLGGVAGWAATGVICWFYWTQTRGLPPVLLSRVRQDRAVLVLGAATAAILFVVGIAEVVTGPPVGFGGACLVTALPVAVLTVYLARTLRPATSRR
jgi:hypothetical protein